MENKENTAEKQVVKTPWYKKPMVWISAIIVAVVGAIIGIIVVSSKKDDAVEEVEGEVETPVEEKPEPVLEEAPYRERRNRWNENHRYNNKKHNN